MVVIGGGDGDRFESDSGSQRLLMATIWLVIVLLVLICDNITLVYLLLASVLNAQLRSPPWGEGSGRPSCLATGWPEVEEEMKKTNWDNSKCQGCLIGPSAIETNETLTCPPASGPTCLEARRLCGASRRRPAPPPSTPAPPRRSPTAPPRQGSSITFSHQCVPLASIWGGNLASFLNKAEAVEPPSYFQPNFIVLDLSEN